MFYFIFHFIMKFRLILKLKKEILEKKKISIKNINLKYFNSFLLKK